MHFHTLDPSLLTGARETSPKCWLKLRASVMFPYNAQQDSAVRTLAGVTVTSLSRICTPSPEPRLCRQ